MYKIEHTQIKVEIKSLVARGSSAAARHARGSSAAARQARAPSTAARQAISLPLKTMPTSNSPLKKSTGVVLRSICPQ